MKTGNEVYSEFCQTASPEQVFEVINWAMDASGNSFDSNRRISERKTTYLPIEIQMISEDFQPVGETLSAVTRDVSVGGIGFITNCPITTSQIRVHFSTENDDTLLMELKYCRLVGSMYLAGASFCVDWSE